MNSELNRIIFTINWVCLVGCFTMINVAQVSCQNTELDSLEDVFTTSTPDTNRLKIIDRMTAIAFEYDLDLALKYSRQGVSLAESIFSDTWLPKFCETQGRMHANLMELDSAMHYFNRALKDYEKIDNKRGMATTEFKIAWVHKRKGNLDLAMESDLHGLRLMEELDNKLGIASALGRVAEGLMYQGQLEESLDYANRGVAICRENNLERGLFYALRSSGDAHLALGNFESAFNDYDEAFKLTETIPLGLFDKADIINSRGNSLKKQGRLEEALSDYKQCLTWSEEVNYLAGTSTAIANIGEVNLLLDNYEDALPFTLKTIELQEHTDDLSNLAENYQHASTIYSQLGDFENALEYERKSRKTYEITKSQESDLAVSELRAQYEAEKSEATILQQAEKLAQRNRILVLSFVFALFMITVLILLFNGYRQRARTNKLLASKNEENELLLKEIHHRVKNNLEVVSGLLFLQSTQVDDVKVKDAMLEGQNRIKSIGILHRKLYQGNNLGAVDIKEYFLNLSENVLDTFGLTERVEVQCDMEHLQLDIDRAVPLGLIVNEILTNSMKYAFPEGRHGKVIISMKEQGEDQWILKVSDDGIGKQEVVNPKGFGSQLIDLLTTQLNGTMQESNEDGSSYTFRFKLNMTHIGETV